MLQTIIIYDIKLTMDIHSRIKILRLLCGLNQEELAAKAGVPRPSLGNYEQGTYVPRDKSLDRLAKVFGVEPGYLRYGSPLVKSQVWLPSIPTNIRRNRETIEDIIKLLPEFIQENRFTSVIEGVLADGNQTLLFGRDSHFDCLLLLTSELGNMLINNFNDLKLHKIEDNPFGTIETFDVNCLSFILMQIENFDAELDYLPMSQSLIRLAALKTRTYTNLDSVELEHAAKNVTFLRDRLLRVADIICDELIDVQSVAQLVSEQKNNNYLPTLDVSSYSDPVSKTFCVILKAAYDLLAKEQQIKPSFPPNQ